MSWSISYKIVLEHETRSVFVKHYASRAAFKCANYSQAFCPGSLLLLAFVDRYRDPGLNIRDLFALLNAAQLYACHSKKQYNITITRKTDTSN